MVEIVKPGTLMRVIDYDERFPGTYDFIDNPPSYHTGGLPPGWRSQGILAHEADYSIDFIDSCYDGYPSWKETIIRIPHLTVGLFVVEHWQGRNRLWYRVLYGENLWWVEGAWLSPLEAPSSILEVL